MHTQPAASTAGLLLSLAASLPPHTPLARRAKQIAPRLNVRHSRALEDRAASLLAQLLTATDTGLTFAESDCLDSEFDD